MQIKNVLVHYTDYSFQKYCEDKYGINRGVYNVIDNWLYDKGVKNITTRRTEIINFLQYILHRLMFTDHFKVKFGKGGLVQKLEEFHEENEFYHKTKESS